MDKNYLPNIKNQKNEQQTSQQTITDQIDQQTPTSTCRFPIRVSWLFNDVTADVVELVK